jgi:hypothetical protein
LKKKKMKADGEEAPPKELPKLVKDEQKEEKPPTAPTRSNIIKPLPPLPQVLKTLLSLTLFLTLFVFLSLSLFLLFESVVADMFVLCCLGTTNCTRLKTITQRPKTSTSITTSLSSRS